MSISRFHRSDLVANLLLSVPLLFFAMGAATRENRRRWACWVAPILLPLLGVGLACTMEFAQLYFPGRTPSLNDIVAQGAGGVIGVVLWLLVGGRVTRWARSLWRERVRHQAAVKLLSGYLVALVIYQLWPFDLIVSPAEVWQKYKAGWITLVPFAAPMRPYILAMKVALMVPVGYLIWMVSRSRGLWLAAGAGLLVAAGIEIGQVFVASRFALSADVILGTAGAVVGAWLAMHLSPRSPRPWTQTPLWQRYAWVLTLGLIVLWSAVVIRKEWSPLDFRWPARGLFGQAVASLRVPLHHLYRTSVFHALTQAARRFGMFFLAGVLVRRLLGSARGGRGWSIGLVCAGAVVIEGGQLFLPSRVPDLATSAPVMALGGIAGALLAPWLRGVFLAPPDAPPQ